MAHRSRSAKDQVGRIGVVGSRTSSDPTYQFVLGAVTAIGPINNTLSLPVRESALGNTLSWRVHTTHDSEFLKILNTTVKIKRENCSIQFLKTQRKNKQKLEYLANIMRVVWRM